MGTKQEVRTTINQYEDDEWIDKGTLLSLVGLSQMRINGAVRDGKLRNSKLIPMEEGKKTEHRVFQVRDVKEWRENTKSHSRREDGRGKFTIYSTPEELERVREVLKENDLDLPIVRANKVKTVKSE